MADEDYSGVYSGIGSGEVDDKPTESPTFGDYLKTAGSSVVGGVLSPIAAGARAASTDAETPEGVAVNRMSKILQGYLNIEAGNIDESRTEVARQRAGAAVTSKEFWDHPVSATMLKATGMSGPIAAMVFSGGPIGAAIAGGGLNAGSYLNDLDKALDGATDDQLRENGWYENLRSMGMSEEDAREDLKSKLLDGKVALNFAAGAIGGALGPAGKLAAGVSGKVAITMAGAEAGVAKRAIAGGVEGALGGSIESGTSAATLQQSEQNAGLKKGFDEEALVNAVLEGGLMGGVMGGAAGAVVKSKGKKGKTTDAVETATDQRAQEQGRGEQVAPVEAPTPVAKEADVSIAPAAQVEAIKSKAAQPKVEATVVDDLSPAPDQALAIAEKQQPTKPEITAEPKPVEPTVAPIPDEVVAASQRLPQPEPDVAPKVTPEVTPVEQPPVSSVAAPIPEPVAPAPVAPVPAAAVKPTGRILKDMSVEGRAKEKAAKDQAKADLKAANAEAKEAAGKKWTAFEKQTIAQRATHAEEIYNEHTKTKHAMPISAAERAAMAAELGKVLDAAAARGLVPREGLAKLGKAASEADQAAFHLSIPEKVGDTGMSPHVRYLREVMAVKKALESKAYGPASKARARVADFIAEHGDLAAMSERRKVDGAAAKEIKQGDVEAPSGKVAEAMATAEPNESTMSPEDRLIAKQEADNERLLVVEEEEAAPPPKRERKKFPDKKPTISAEKIAEIKQAAKDRAAPPAAEPAPAPVKKVGISDEMKAKYLAMSAAAMKKNDDGGVSKLEAAESVNKNKDYIEAALTDRQVPKDVETGEPVEILHTTTAKKALESLDLSHLDGVPAALAKFAQRRFAAMAGDTPVHTLDKTAMAKTLGDLDTAFEEDGKGNIGLNRLPLSGEQGYVLLRHDALQTPAQTAHVVLHEVTHAATMRALVENPQIHEHVEGMMREVRDFLPSLPSDFKQKMAYAMSNPREFIAEAFSNPDVQEILAHIPVSDKLAKSLRLEKTQRLSVWDAIVNVVRGIIEKSTGRLPEGHRMIEAVMRVGENIGRENQLTASLAEGKARPIIRHGLDDPNLDARLTVKQAGERAADALTNSGSWLGNTKDKLSSTFMLKERHNERFGPSRPLNRVFDERAKQAREADRILNDNGGAEVVRRTAELERSHPADMAKGADLLFDASLHDVNLGPGASNDHLGKDATKGWQGKKLLAGMQRRYDSLAPEVQKHLQESVKFFRTIHNDVSMATIKNVLDVANIQQHGLAERIFKDGVTDADRSLHGGEIIKALEKATSLKEMKGWYAPFRRYGDFISTGEHELALPAGAVKINDNTVQFHNPKSQVGSRRAAKAFIEQASHTSQGNQLKANEIQRVTVDRNDLSKIVDPSDVDAVVAYRVRMQTQHTEFHDSLSDAQRNQETLTAGGLTRTKVHKREDAHRASPGLEGALGTVISSLEQNQSYRSLDSTQQAAVKQSLMDASVRALSSTNVKTSMAPRRNVAGMSHDLGRVTADYARMTANYLAQLRFRPKIDKIFAEMRAYMKAHEYDQDNHRRQEVYQEFQSRMYGAGEVLASRAPNPVIRKLLQISRLSRLAGVSFHVINSQEPWTTSLPVIAGRHGFVQTARTMTGIYNAIGARGGIVSGLKDIGAAFNHDSGFTDYVKLFKDNIAKSNTMGGSKSARFLEMLDYMNDRNLYGNDTIYEVGKSANPNGNVASRALDRADLMANQVGSAIEAINRTVTGLTAYDLEYKKNGGNHEAAMNYAYNRAHETMGDYSSWNAAPIFNSRAGQLALQFKKFGHKTYYLLGKTIGNAARGDREAMKQFAGLMVTHGLVAGVLGLPTEPFKVALMAANMAGITGFTPEDYDNAVRQLAARVAGAKGGEIISKGLYRGIGIEVSGRMGLDSMLTYGSPKTDKANDIKAWLFDTMAGAPAGYVLDQIAAAKALSTGDVATAIQKASPVRAVGDIAKAVTGAMGPKLSPQGREQQKALSPYQTAVRAVGFTPSATAESGAMRGHVASESKKLTGARTELINAWVNASGAKKVAAQRAVQQWNVGKPKETRIEQKDLASAATRRETEEDNGSFKNGIKIGKRTKEIYDRAERTYNP